MWVTLEDKRREEKSMPQQYLKYIDRSREQSVKWDKEFHSRTPRETSFSSGNATTHQNSLNTFLGEILSY